MYLCFVFSILALECIILSYIELQFKTTRWMVKLWSAAASCVPTIYTRVVPPSEYFHFSVFHQQRRKICEKSIWDNPLLQPEILCILCDMVRMVLCQRVQFSYLLTYTHAHPGCLERQILGIAQAVDHEKLEPSFSQHLSHLQPQLYRHFWSGNTT